MCSSRKIKGLVVRAMRRMSVRRWRDFGGGGGGGEGFGGVVLVDVVVEWRWVLWWRGRGGERGRRDGGRSGRRGGILMWISVGL